MSRIRGKDTKPEILVRKYLFGRGLRYRLHAKDLPGNPDIVFSGLGAVIFIHGCFWHGHQPCKIYKPPSTNPAFWLAKVETNKKRDARNTSMLRSLGWKVIVVRECQLAPKVREKTLERLYLRLME